MYLRFALFACLLLTNRHNWIPIMSRQDSNWKYVSETHRRIYKGLFYIYISANKCIELEFCIQKLFVGYFFFVNIFTIHISVPILVDIFIFMEDLLCVLCYQQQRQKKWKRFSFQIWRDIEKFNLCLRILCVCHDKATEPTWNI